MEHMNFIKDMFEWGLQHISTRKHVILPDALVGATQNSQKHKQYLDRCYIFWNIWNIYWSFHITR